MRAISELVATSHTRTILSSLADKTYFPSRLKATDVTLLSWVKWAISFPVATTTTLAVPSQLPDTTYFPSGLKATDVTTPFWTVRTRGRARSLLCKTRAASTEGDI